jgi:hypothetical protein
MRGASGKFGERLCYATVLLVTVCERLKLGVVMIALAAGVLP